MNEYKGKIINGLPAQQLPFNRKTKEWRKKHLDFCDARSFFNDSVVRNTVLHKKINYDLINGKLDIKDLEMIINPDNLNVGYIPNKIQHYPIINAKLNVLRGEESKRVFDFKVVVTNPNAISEIENNKKAELQSRIMEWIQKTNQTPEKSEEELSKINDYYNYEWQDMREVRANALLNHYMKELNIPLMFNNGFMDAVTVGEEIYQVDIIGGEPTVERVNPIKIRVFKSGFSNKIEDADVIVLEDYWSVGKVIDAFYDVLTEKDRKYLERQPYEGNGAYTDDMDTIDPTIGFRPMISDEITPEDFNPEEYFKSDDIDSLSPFDTAGNVKVLRMYWKSRRKIKKVKSYNQETGEEEYNFYPETYVLREDMGEEEEIFWINEAWEGTKIGKDIYVNMRPRPIQYNRLGNPSRCHFGIIGSIYNFNDGKPFSLVDMMKPYNYLYDVIHDRLNKMIAHNWGKLIRMDLAKVPKGWDVEKWLYYAKTSNILVEDSFKEGNIGASTGKLAGAMNNASSGYVDAEMGNSIQSMIELLEFIKNEMSEAPGISRQREGQISNRETVGGVERANLQSSHITEWLFTIHDDVKKRVLEAFLETSKIALKGHNKKFQYILSDNSTRIADIDGDEYAECDYGLVVDNSNGIQELKQKLDMLAQAALQNQTLNFSTIMKLYQSNSFAEKQRMVEKNEQELQQQAQQQQQQQLQQQQEIAQMQAQQAQAAMEQQYKMNQENNETKIIVAEINSQAEAQRFAMMNGDDGTAEMDNRKLDEQMRQFDEKLRLEREKLSQQDKQFRQQLAFNKQKQAEDARLKAKQIAKSKTTSK